MKNLKIVSAVVASVVASSALAASGDMYGRVDAGYSMSSPKTHIFTGTSTEYKSKSNQFTGNVGLGYYYTDEVRMDVNFGFTPSTSTKLKKDGKKTDMKVKVSTYTGMINGYYDFTGMDVVPYVTAGLGFISASAKVSGKDASGKDVSAKAKTKSAFAYQAGLGAAYEVTSGVFLDAGYRFTGSTFKKSKSKTSVVPGASHAFLLGARVNF